VIQDTVIPDDGCFSDYNAHSVIDETSAPNRRSWMNLDSRRRSRLSGNQSGDEMSATLPGCMCKPMPDHRPETGIRHDIKEATRSGILIDNGLYVFPEKMKHLFSSYRCGTHGAMSDDKGIFVTSP
jgi:hypothetical protein